MPTVVRCQNAEEFHEKAFDWLGQKEAENNLILGITSNILSKPFFDRQEHYFWVVEDEGRVVGTAFLTPPYKFTITEMPVEALQALANEIRNTLPGIPGVCGPQESCKRFSHYWNLKTQKSPRLEMSMRIYRLDQLETASFNAGVMKNAGEDDISRLIEWTRQFNQETQLRDQMDEKTIVEGYVREQRLYIWEDGEARAMAGYAGPTPNGLRVNMVYTPPEFRRQGYATSLVAALSQKILDSGKKFCFLYTDLFNPTSNGIYQKIGYQPVCDWSVYQFK
jgi:uncharacterized protein